mgnify:CR=1 FL=1
MTVQHECYDCRHHSLGHPCRVAGILDVDGLAAHYVREFCRPLPSTPGADEDQHWSFCCVSGLVEMDPERAWLFVLSAVRQLRTVEQAMYFAAGPLEELIAYHGPKVIERVETEDRRSPRFRQVLKGVWPLGTRHTPEWKRVEMLQRATPSLDSTDLLPEF